MGEGCLLTDYLPVLIHPRLKLKNLYTTYIKWKQKQVFLEPNFLKKEREEGEGEGELFDLMAQGAGPIFGGG